MPAIRPSSIGVERLCELRYPDKSVRERITALAADVSVAVGTARKWYYGERWPPIDMLKDLPAPPRRRYRHGHGNERTKTDVASDLLKQGDLPDAQIAEKAGITRSRLYDIKKSMVVAGVLPRDRITPRRISDKAQPEA